MLNRPKSLAPEPHLSGYLELLYRVSIFVKLHSEGEMRLPDRQLFDLMDAIHNIPEMLLEYEGPGYDEKDMRRLFLESYDGKWARDEGSFSLVTALDDAIRRVRERDASV
ncbi:MAG: hypothetical protein GY778_32240 [bacterium]|nr:hypothetical protein [bacterium]